MAHPGTVHLRNPGQLLGISFLLLPSGAWGGAQFSGLDLQCLKVNGSSQVGSGSSSVLQYLTVVHVCSGDSDYCSIAFKILCLLYK